MLGHTWRLRATNTQNQSITVTVRARYWKFDSTGALSWSSEQTLLSGVSIAASGGTSVSTTIDNSVDKYVGMSILVTCTAAAATNGSGAVTLSVERSTDAGTTWPTAGQGEIIGGYTVTAADSTNARLKNLLVG